MLSPRPSMMPTEKRPGGLLRLSRRDILRAAGFATVGASLFPHAATADVGRVPGAIVQIAMGYVNTTDWEPSKDLFGGQKSYYCNEFVAVVVRKAGGATWLPIERPGPYPRFRDPLASEWQDPSVALRGWIVVHPTDSSRKLTAYRKLLDLRKEGDVVAGGGHVGILSDRRNDAEYRKDSFVSSGHWLAVSASADSGAVELNAWSSRIPDVQRYSNAAQYDKDALSSVSKFTVRRFVGA